MNANLVPAGLSPSPCTHRVTKRPNPTTCRDLVPALAGSPCTQNVPLTWGLQGLQGLKGPFPLKLGEVVKYMSWEIPIDSPRSLQSLHSLHAGGSR